MEPIQVVVVDEHEIFRRGVVACLREQPDVTVLADLAAGPVGALEGNPDVAIVSDASASIPELTSCPLLVCAAHHSGLRAGHHRVRGVLPRATLTPEQLVGATRAVAAGLAVGSLSEGEPHVLDARSRDVLRLLAEGANTQQISVQLSCSPRTVKTVISRIEDRLEARTRAEAVAKGIRDELI